MITLFKKTSVWWPVVAGLVVLLTGITLTAPDVERAAVGQGDNITNELPPSVQMQFMRPGQLEAAARKFPVVYVPFGLIEWHGKHLPLGNDALKAHAILVKTAERFGGVVYPPVYFHEGFDRKAFVPVLAELFERLKKTGFRVIIGVSGHNVRDRST